MLKGEKIRFDIHNILYSIYKYNKTLDNSDIKNIIKNNLEKDISFVNYVVLNSLRFHIHAIKILKQYIKKRTRDHEKILLISAITQIVFLDIKEYAVINCSVEIAKKLKIYHGLINASLKQIAINKKSLRNIKIEFNDLPHWFVNKVKELDDNERKDFIQNFFEEPDLHIVFKNKDKLKNFDQKIYLTSETSGFLIDKNTNGLENIKSYFNGDWWVQDFSSFFPLDNIQFVNKKMRFLDSCAAPGGKSFQILSKKINITLNDKSKSRIEILKNNLKRLRFKAKILNKDFIKLNSTQKYDFIIIDAPCSAVGTIRKNPEIFFKRKEPNFEYLVKIQEQMLNKASLLVNSNGFILYMVCSFIKNETENQIHKFLKNNNDFRLYDFTLNKKNMQYKKLFKKKFMFTLPSKFFEYNIDGFFAAYLKKIK